MPSKFCQSLTSETGTEDNPPFARDGPGGGGGDVSIFRRLGVETLPDPFSSMTITYELPDCVWPFTVSLLTLENGNWNWPNDRATPDGPNDPWINSSYTIGFD